MTIPSPEDQARLIEQFDDFQQGARARHERVLLLGYYERGGIGSALADERDALGLLMAGPAAYEKIDRTFHVWRLDQPSETAKIFKTVAEVDEYLSEVETFPRYSLTLDDNPRLEIETGGDNVRITDKLLRKHFVILRSDLESFAIRSTGATQLFVHAETAPTIGDWTQE
ncbi:hypothetical protein V4U86_18090 [Mycobacterium sp. AMU20-3851]|uniref:hypothetical protein n=1 Tax=Mycobacterium sp. AMU20-3851 TaxID=3122055 RepID=UPI0037548072